MIKEDFDKIIAPRVKKIKVPGYTINYRVWGTGHPLVCIPGWPLPSSSFAPFAYVASKQIQVISLDLPGWAQAPVGKKEIDTIDGYAQVVERFVKCMGIKEFSLLGYSYGGIVAQRVAIRNKVVPSKLILISTLYSTRFLKDRKYGAGMALLDIVMKNGLSESRVRSLIKNAYRLIYMTRSYRYIIDTELVQQMVEETVHGDMMTLYLSGKALMENRPISKDDFNCPVFVEYATDDMAFIREDSREIAETMGIEPFVLDGYDHSHLFVCPEVSVKPIEEFVFS